MGSSKYNLDNIDIDLFDELDDKEYEDSMDEPEFDEAELNLLMQRKYPVNLFA